MSEEAIEATIHGSFFKAIRCFIKALIFMEVVPETVSLLFYNSKSAIFNICVFPFKHVIIVVDWYLLFVFYYFDMVEVSI